MTPILSSGDCVVCDFNREGATGGRTGMSRNLLNIRVKIFDLAAGAPIYKTFTKSLLQGPLQSGYIEDSMKGMACRQYLWLSL